MIKFFDKKYVWALRAFFSLFFLSALMQIMHWPFVDEIRMIASLIIVVFYPLRFAKKTSKNWLDYIKLLLAISFIFNLLSLKSFENIQLFIQSTLFMIWFFNEGFFYFSYQTIFHKKERSSQDILDVEDRDIQKSTFLPLVDTAFILCIAISVAGALFRIMHWPYSAYLLIIGMSGLSLLIWFKRFNEE